MFIGYYLVHKFEFVRRSNDFPKINWSKYICKIANIQTKHF